MRIKLEDSRHALLYDTFYVHIDVVSRRNGYNIFFFQDTCLNKNKLDTCSYKEEKNSKK